MPSSQTKGRVICSASGTWIGPDQAAPSVQDAAGALGKLCRYGGHCKEFYCVLIHSLIVDDLTDGNEAKLYSLIHDTTESVINDIPKPFKIPSMEELEARMYSRILRDWVISFPEKHVLVQVHQADYEALLGEIWTIGPPNLRNLKQFRKRSRRAERLVRHYQKKYPPRDTIHSTGRAVKEFLSRYKMYKSRIEKGESE
jgi:hypothetical protein